jgi:hypothetical protein
MSKQIGEIRLECNDCSHQGVVSSDLIKHRLGEPLSYSNIAELWPKFRCSRCGSRHVCVSDEDKGLLLDPENVRRCQDCGIAILLPRIQALPTAITCQVCAQEGEQPERPSPYPTPPPSLSICPRCKRPTVVRENMTDGNYFIGCTSFPKCRWTAELSTERF